MAGLLHLRKSEVTFMRYLNFTLRSADAATLWCHEWRGSEAKAVVQIVHGAFEHAARYAPFARALGACGFAIIAEDHRGHGQTAQAPDELGRMGPANCIELAAEDVIRLTLEARLRLPRLPVILFGHSLGSLISQRVLARNGELYEAVVLSGALSAAGLTEVKPLIDEAAASHGRDTPAESLQRALLSELLVNIEAPRTAFDWLSRDGAEVDRYLADPRCGFALTHGTWQDIAEVAPLTVDAAELTRLRRDLPVLILSGEADPVHGKGTAIRELNAAYRGAGISQVCTRLYAEGRHEMLNEINREEVIHDTIEWMEGALARARLP